MGNNLAIGAGLEGGTPLGLNLLAQLPGVDDVSVVGNRQRTVQSVDEQRLGVGAPTGSGGRVPGMTDGHFPGDTVDVAVAKCFRHQPHAGVYLDSALVYGGDPGRFLPPVLQCEQADGGHRGAVRTRRVHAHHPALFAGVIKGV